jgi:hypothetical protein
VLHKWHDRQSEGRALHSQKQLPARTDCVTAGELKSCGLLPVVQATQQGYSA